MSSNNKEDPNRDGGNSNKRDRPEGYTSMNEISHQPKVTKIKPEPKDVSMHDEHSPQPKVTNIKPEPGDVSVHDEHNPVSVHDEHNPQPKVAKIKLEPKNVPMHDEHSPQLKVTNIKLEPKLEPKDVPMHDEHSPQPKVTNIKLEPKLEPKPEPEDGSVHDEYSPPPKVNLALEGLETGSLRRYCRHYKIMGIGSESSREEMLTAVQHHFASQPPLNEETVIAEFVNASQRRQKEIKPEDQESS